MVSFASIVAAETKCKSFDWGKDRRRPVSLGEKDGSGESGDCENWDLQKKEWAPKI